MAVRHKVAGKRRRAVHRGRAKAAGAARRSQGHSRRNQARRSAATATHPDAIALLKADHKAVKSVLDSLKTAHGPRAAELLERARTLLASHTDIEESIFYPAYRAAAAAKTDRRLFHEAMAEHHTVDLILPDVKSAQGDDDAFAARAKVLAEVVRHHIAEEEGKMFPRARGLLSAEELRSLGEQMRARQREATTSSPLRVVASLIGIS